MDAHLTLLLARMRSLREASSDDRSREDPDQAVSVWWGKVRSPNRLQPLPHLDEILALDDAARDAAQEVHLYLTDYRSLYVGHVVEITTDDVMESDDDDVPPYYRKAGLRSDCWFRLADIRRLVADDLLCVIAELAKLRNTRYHDRPVSLYGGMTELPLIVTREDGATFFDPGFREALTDGKYWAEFDAERTGLGPAERELRESMFGESAWNALDPGARGFIASAEHLIRSERRTPAFDFSAVVMSLAKAAEVQTNLTLRRAMLRAKTEERRANVDGKTADVATGPHLSLGALARVLKEPGVRAALCRLVRDGQWFTGQWPSVLDRLASYRNPAAHQRHITLEEALHLRNDMVGVGCTGELVRLARVQPLR
jgi:hypothetical protein